MNMKLYTNPLSGNARKVDFLVRHLDLPVERVTVDLRAGAQRQPDFLKLNPNGKVPVLVDGEFVLWESTAIWRYLAEPNAPELLGSDRRERAEVDRWTSWQLAHFGPTISTLNQERTLKPMMGGEPDAAAIENAVGELDRLSRIVATHLSQNTYLCGDRWTLADVALAMSVGCAPISGEDFAAYPAITAWFERMRALEAWEDIPFPPRR